jgi:small conductance mechanosensitive channel
LEEQQTLWNTPIINHSREPDRRQDLSISVGNDQDIRTVKDTLLAIIRADERVQKDPALRVFSDDLAANRTTLKIECWAKTGEWTETRYDMIDAIKQGLAEQGMPIK